MRALIQESKRTGITKQRWAADKQLDGIDLETLSEQAIVLTAPLSKVQKALEKPMKPGRSLISVVRYTNGTIEEVSEKNLGVIDTAPEEPTEEEKAASTALAVDQSKPKPAAAVTVATPTLGCPAPDFAAIEHRASRVLQAFLTEEQLADFQREQSFVQRGADTGDLYIITSRNAPAARRKFASTRSLYNYSQNQALCVHDWTVPAAEEMLSLMLHLQTPGWENYLRRIPE